MKLWLVREDQKVAFYQVFCQAVDGFGEFGADSAEAYAQQGCGFRMSVLLENDAADDLPVQYRQAVEAALHIQDENQRVFERAYAAAGDPAAANGLAKEVGGAADLKRGVEVALQQVLSVFAIEGPGDHGFRGRLRLRIGFWEPPLRVMDVPRCRAQKAEVRGRLRGCPKLGDLRKGELESGAQ
jgi:hypothetical protein